MPDGPRTRIRVFFGAGLILAALIGGARSGRLGAGTDDTVAPHNCRFWGITGPAPPGLIDTHLRSGTHDNLKELSLRDRDGWGIVSFPTAPGASALVQPLARRGGVYAANPYDPDFDLAVGELEGLFPSSALAHVRTATAAHDGVPDPHPFVREGFAFAHNGAVNVQTLTEMLTADDPTYLLTHPPAYSGEIIDSELYLLWLLKYRHQHRDLSTLEALQGAVTLLYARVAPQRLNFVLTRGDTLWACRCAGTDTLDPVRRHPAVSDPPSPYWVVCSAPVGNDSLDWSPFPAHSVAAFVPGQIPSYLPIGLPAALGEPDDGMVEPPLGVERTAWLGAPTPNPTAGGVRIPLGARAPAGEIRCEIWNAAGARIWSAAVAGRGRDGVPSAVSWPGLDCDGRTVPPGVYFCRVHAGGEHAERTITVVR